MGRKRSPILQHVNKTLMKAVKAACHFHSDVKFRDWLKKYQDTIQPIYDGLTGKVSLINIKFDGKHKFYDSLCSQENINEEVQGL